MNKIGLTFAVLPLLSSFQVFADPTVQDFEGGGTDYSLSSVPAGALPQLVTESPSNTYLRLLANTLSSNGAVFFDQTEFDPLKKVTVEFDFRMFDGQFNDHADGIGFLLLNSEDWGSTGPVALSNGLDNGVEPWREAKGRNSIGIGFDIYFNPLTGAFEPNDNHVSVHYNRELLASFDPGFPLHSIAAGDFHTASITIEFLPEGASVSLDLTSASSVATSPINSFIIPNVAPYEARVAIGANSGATSAFHDIDNVWADFTAVPEPVSSSLAAMLLGLLLAFRCYRT